ncbi:MAG TPA: mechanosensitive ion channel family protein [Candidatus Binataceae bacterium]|nr:mechanosensitive ion channel family protein [Candidatus Binataceae bacterium]
MEPTPLQAILGLSLLSHDERMIAEAILAIAAALGAATLRGRRTSVRAPALVMCSLGFLSDLIATPYSVQGAQWARWPAAIGMVLVTWGVIKALLDTADTVAHRRRAHFSTIFKDLLTILLFVLILMGVLSEEIHIDPTPLLASSAVIAVVLGLALQESLGNVFSGLTLQLGKPFAPGDWVRSGNFVGRIQGIGWRSTAMITRDNEKLEIPNSMLAKEIVVNYSNGVVADEVVLGLSYDAPPNYVRDVITESLRGVPGVLQNPPPAILTWDYADYSIRYRIKYWMADYADAERVHDQVSTSLWYALRRKAIEIPFPIRTLRRARENAVIAGEEAFEREIMNELRQVDFLRDLRDEELRLLLAGVTVLKFGAGETIVREGDQGDSLYIIRSGTVEVVASASDGKQVHLRDLRNPAFFGEMALMTGEVRNATIRARTDAELLELSRDGFTELFKLHPESAARMGEVIALRMTERRELLAAAPQDDGARTHAGWLLAKMRAVFNIAPVR